DLSGRKSLVGKARRGNVERRAENDVASATEHAAELRGPAAAVVELTRAQGRRHAQRAAGRALELHVGTRPPVAPGRDGDVTKYLERRGRRVEIALNVHLEGIAGFEIAAQH